MIFLPRFSFDSFHSVGLWLALLFAGFFFHSPAFSQTDPNQPNVLLIISDDLGVDATNGYQNNAVMPTTPTLDSLRTSGLTFSNAWSAPVCTPTRANVLSGKYGIKTGVLNAPGNLNLSDTSIFTQVQQLSNNAYATGYIGKWHTTMPQDPNHPFDHGIDHFEGIMGSGVTDYYNWTKFAGGVSSAETTYATTYLTNSAIQWVNTQTSPWVLFLAEMAPHSPLHIPPSDLYTISNLTPNRRKFMAAIEAMDAEIGRLLANIPSAVLSNTLIIYIGDNGTPGNVIQSFPSDRAKGTLYQGGINVPFFISGPMVTRVNETEASLVHVVDVFATIWEVSGHGLPGGKDNSWSLLPLLSDASAPDKPFNYTELSSTDVTGWTIRNDQYKLLNLDSTGQEFYDLINDPFEANDLMGSLTPAQDSIRVVLETEAVAIRSGWSCQDLIQNGDEEGIDCGGSSCAPCVPTGVQGLANHLDLKVFPNPTTGEFSVYVGDARVERIEVYDGLGRLLLREGKSIASLVKLDLGTLPAQMGWVRVVTNKGSQAVRLMIE